MSKYAPFDTKQSQTLKTLLAEVGGGGSDFGVVDLGIVEEAATGQILYAYDVVEGVLHFTNLSLVDTLAPGIVLGYLASLPNFTAGNVLAVNATDDGVEWIVP